MSKPQINVTPLIDVLLVLLIIFMVVTPMKPSAFEAKVPQEPDDRPVNPNPYTLVVFVNFDSTLRLNKEAFTATVDDPTALIERLASVFDQRTRNLAFAENTAGDAAPRIEKTVFIKAPHGLDYGTVAKVVDVVKMAGANPVSLQIDDLE